MAQTISLCELISLIIGFVILYGNQFVSKNKNKLNHIFSILVLVNCLGMAADMISWILDGKEEYVTYTFLSTTLATVLCFVVPSCFLWYLGEYIYKKTGKSMRRFQNGSILSMTAVLVFLELSLTGKLFTFENGFYKELPGYKAYMMVNVVIILYVFAIILLSARDLGRQESIAAVVYVCIPIISMVINSINPNYAFTYPAMTISLLFIYISIQSYNENALIQQEMVTSYLASHDDLTGLLNRRAFTDRVDSMAGDVEISVLFCDVNGLKYTNDHYGHVRGDMLLEEFSNLLKTYFDKEFIYRISGDEFVVIFHKLDEREMLFKKSQLENTQTDLDYPIACIGMASGNASQILQLLRVSEENMYEEKKKFYENYPQFKR